MGSIRPHWRTYFTVEDAEKTIRQAVALGAKVSMRIRILPSNACFAAVTSPQGVEFGIIQAE
jgi:predicted enzyme related to lactoylglutathione lyase